MVGKNDTLLIRHLPSELSHKEKEEFLKHFGAIDVQILGSENKKSNLVYAKYESSNAAQVALKRLHQLEVLGHLLSVELARGNDGINKTSCVSSHLQQIEKQDHLRRQREAFFQKLNSWTKLIDINYPPPVHLYYQYSPPTHQVLENICKAMINVPKFYTQVLHLMNKMNLPCPFTDNYPLQSNLTVEKEVVHNQSNDNNKDREQIIAETVSEDESEIESDPDDKSADINREENLVQWKRKRTAQNPVKRRKFVKPVAPINTQPKPVLKAEEVFEIFDKDPLQRKIELKLTPGLDSIQESKETQNVISNESFGIIHSTVKNADKEKDSELNKMGDEENIEICITSEALAANRISTRDQRVLPVFKNYQAGAPSCRLYIKNLAKQVIAKDLHFIYRRFTMPQTDDQGNMFDVRLMQEGRMKGQAFVSLQNVELAQKALKETNGYILKDKPMVVQFARSAAAK